VAFCVTNGLGYGEPAEAEVKTAMEYVAHNLIEALPDIFAGCDLVLRSMRGVAMGIAFISKDGKTLAYAGIGNTCAMIFREYHSGLAEGRVIHLSGNSGIVGGYKALLSKTVTLLPSNHVILSVDGVRECLDVSGYNDAICPDRQRLAEKIIEDWGRATDDVAILIFRNKMG
jgi:hypothetical protein